MDEKMAREAWEKATAGILNDVTLDNAEKVAAMLDLLEYDAMTRKAVKNDYGRHGDVIEINVCAYLRGNSAKARDVHVKGRNRKDMVYKGYTLEIGSNGKTMATRDANKYEAPYNITGWNINDVLAKKCNYIVYGVRAQQIVENASYPYDMYVFSKQEFGEFLENSGLHGLKTNMGVTKYGYALTIHYNESYARRFDAWVQAHNIPTLEKFKMTMEG